MTTLTNNDNLLRNALRGNGVFSGISGLILIGDAGPIAAFMGIGYTLPFIVVGVGLLLHAANLLINTAQRPVSKALGWFAIVGDAVWVVASIIILMTDAFALTSGGKWTLMIVADIVLIFAIVQYVGLRRMNRASN